MSELRQAEDKLRRENISGKQKANDVHYQVGAKVRQTIKELGGTMPEDLPTAESIKLVESKQKETAEAERKRRTKLNEQETTHMGRFFHINNSIL